MRFILLLCAVLLTNCTGKLPETVTQDIVQVTIFSSSWFKTDTKVTVFPDLEQNFIISLPHLCTTNDYACGNSLY